MQLGVFCGLFLLRARETCFNDANGAKALLMDSRPPVLLLLLLLPPDDEPEPVKPPTIWVSAPTCGKFSRCGRRVGAGQKVSMNGAKRW